VKATDGVNLIITIIIIIIIIAIAIATMAVIRIEYSPFKIISNTPID